MDVCRFDPTLFIYVAKAEEDGVLVGDEDNEDLHYKKGELVIVESSKVDIEVKPGVSRKAEKWVVTDVVNIDELRADWIPSDRALAERLFGKI